MQIPGQIWMQFNNLEHVAVDELDPSIELAGGEYDVEVGEVEPDFDEEP